MSRDCKCAENRAPKGALGTRLWGTSLSLTHLVAGTPSHLPTIWKHAPWELLGELNARGQGGVDLSVLLDDSARLLGTDPAGDTLLPSASHSFTSRPVAQGCGARWWPPGCVSLAVVVASPVAGLLARSDSADFLSEDRRSPTGSQRREIIRRKNYFYRGKIQLPGRTYSFAQIHPSCVRRVGRGAAAKTMASAITIIESEKPAGAVGERSESQF